MIKKLTGTKGGSGVAERIISEMPAHSVYVEPFWGRGTIARKKRPAEVTIGCDLDEEALAHGRQYATMFATCGVQWLKDYFGLSLPDGGDAYTCDATRCEAFGYTAADHFVYIDPPYWGVRPYYRHILSEQQHRDLCRAFLALPCPAAISGYHSDLYADELRGVRSIEINTRTRRGPATEVVWFNYDPPLWYHDVRFVGKDRRERERINRRRRTWQTGLERMPPRERQAVLEACIASLLPSGDAAAICGRVLRTITTAQPHQPANYQPPRDASEGLPSRLAGSPQRGGGGRKIRSVVGDRRYPSCERGQN